MTLLGRDGIWRTIEEVLRNDAGGALLIVGEPGIGKTSLLHRASESAIAAGHRVLHAAVGEFQTPSGLEGLGALLSPLQPHVPALSATQRSAIAFAFGADIVPPPSEPTINAAVLALLRIAADRTPILLVVDDVQWLDAASSNILGFVARRLAGTRVKLLAATRTGYSNAVERAGLASHELAPLDERAARRLLRQHHPHLATTDRERVVGAAAGNPLALLELPREAEGHSLAQKLPHSLPMRLPDSVAVLFGQRISSLPALTRDALLIAALEGTGDLGLVILAAGDAALDHLSVAEQTGLLVIDETMGTLRFCHPLVPATVVTLADETQRRETHSRLTAVLLDWPMRRIWHLAQAAEGPDEQTAALVEEHAHLALRRGDAANAIDLLQRAATLSPTPAQRAHRQVQAAFIGADVTGDLSGARELLADADRLHPTLTRSLPASLAASFLLLNAECDVDTAHRVLVDAIRTHPGRADPHDPILDAALHSLLMMCWFSGRASQWDDFHEATTRLRSQVPPLVDVCHRTFGDPTHQGAGALSDLAKLLQELPTERDPVRITRLGLACVYTDQLPKCRQALRQVIDDGLEGGAVALAINAVVSSCVDAWLTGQWDEALNLAGEGMKLCREHGYRRYSVILGGYIDQLVRIARGDIEGGRHAAEEMTQWAIDRGAGMSAVFAQHLFTLRAVALGDFESAYHHAAAIAPPGELASYNPHALWVLFDLVESAMFTGRLEHAQFHVMAMRHLQIESLSPRVRMVVEGCTALTALGQEAGDAFETALAIPEGPQWPFDRARIELAYGEHLRRQRDVAQARLHLAAASGVFQRLGARPWQIRAEAALRAAGVGARSHVQRRNITATLTARERQIAELAAQGLSNRQIGDQLHLSHRSIGAALYRLFPKLGITSRTALAAAIEDLPTEIGEEPRTDKQQ